MLDQIIIFPEILSAFQGILSGQASLTTYIILALIPVCIGVAIREIWCWFNKQSKLVSKMDRIERQLIKTNQLLENLGKIMKEEKPSTHTQKIEAEKAFVPSSPKDYSKADNTQHQEESRVEPKSLGDRKFSL